MTLAQELRDGSGEHLDFWKMEAYSAKAKELEDVLLNIYMAYHVSQLREEPKALIKAWKLGQEIYIDRRRES